MQTSKLVYPAPEFGDQTSVAKALEAGGAEWRRGDVREAVRWLRRAAEAAEAHGNDLRAVGLARVAADFMTKLEISPDSSPRDEASVLASFDDFNDQTIVDSPAIVTARAMQQSGVALLQGLEPASSPEPGSSPEPASNPEAASSPTSTAGSKSVPAPPRPDKSVKPRAPLKPVAVSAPRSRRALRVAVVRPKSGGRSLVAEVLDEGAPLPPGASEALLVWLDPDAGGFDGT
jgi:hypothetical protein